MYWHYVSKFIGRYTCTCMHVYKNTDNTRHKSIIINTQIFYLCYMYMCVHQSGVKKVYTYDYVHVYNYYVYTAQENRQTQLYIII